MATVRATLPHTPDPPPSTSTQKISICLWGKKICVKTMRCDETRTLVNLFNCYLLSFIRSSGRKGSRRCSRCAAIKERERGLCLVLAVACMLRAKLRDQWQRGCYHSTWSRHSSGGREGDGMGGGGGVPGGSFWLERRVLCWKARERDRLLEANPPGSVRALQQKHLDIPGNICLGERTNLNKRATRERDDLKRFWRRVCSEKTCAASRAWN